MNARQQRFVEEYLVDLNATQAAIRAGYSPKHADVNGPRLLGNAGVKKAIDEAIARRSAKLELDVEWVIRRLSWIAAADPRRLFDKKGRLLPPHKWDDETAYAVQSYEEGKVRLAPKTPALELIGRHLNAWVEKLRLSGDLTIKPAVDVSKASDDQLRTIREALAPVLAAAGSGPGPAETGR